MLACIVGGIGLALFRHQRGSEPQSEAVANTPAVVESTIPMPITPNPEKAGRNPTAKEFVGITGYINSPSADGGDTPFRLADWVGRRVILLVFWGVDCVNCRRVQPYINAWHDRYKEKGLLTIGVHAPVSEAERDYSSVSNAVRDQRMTYPVVLDTNFATWDLYENDAWPRLYLIDTDGYIVYSHRGEDAYLETETKMRELLIEHAQERGNPLPILGVIPSESPAGEVNRDPRDPGYRTRGW